MRRTRSSRPARRPTDRRIEHVSERSSRSTTCLGGRRGIGSSTARRTDLEVCKRSAAGSSNDLVNASRPASRPAEGLRAVRARGAEPRGIRVCDLVRIDIDADHLVPEFGHADRACGSEVAGSETAQRMGNSYILDDHAAYLAIAEGERHVYISSYPILS